MAAQRVAGLDRARLAAFRNAEAARYAAARPRSAAAAAAAAAHWLDAVPMHWMRDWPLPFPPVADRARGARLTCIDGITLDDFCLGDTGSMFGHSPPPVARALRAQAGRGLTFMLPTEAAAAAGRLLAEVWGDFRWQVAMTATDANRFALRVARAVTGRPKVLVFEGAYHGTVDDTMVARDAAGRTVARPGLVGQVQDLSLGAVCVPFNDLDAVGEALATGEVAAVITEPVMTNSCMVLPERGFLAALRDLCTARGALLIIDETHTQSTGRGGYTAAHGLDPDILVVGKCVAGGVPVAVWGLRPQVADRLAAYHATRPPGHSGMGTTLSANPVQFAALAATLAEVATPAAHARMEAGAARLEAGLAAAIATADLPWHVVRVGARVEFICAPGPLRDGTEAAAAHAPEVEGALHLGLVNRGALIAPFHNMMLVSPATSAAQVARLVAAFGQVLGALTGETP
jgi:glutamate-1-semialdehyde 2,1-aminomutase